MTALPQRFPILPSAMKGKAPMSVPWGFVEPHRVQATSNHGGQTIERLAHRGGLSPRELYAVITDQKFRDVPSMSEERAWQLVQALLKGEELEKP